MNPTVPQGPPREPMKRYEEGTYPDKKFTPVANQVAFVIIKEQREFLTLPDNARDSMSTPRCYVVAVGPETRWCKPGDVIFVHATAPMRRVSIGGDDYGVVEEVSPIIGVGYLGVEDRTGKK